MQHLLSSLRKTPAELIAAFQALATWKILNCADKGILQATTAGRMSGWTNDGTSGTNYVTAAAANEPLYRDTDPTLGRASVSGDGLAYYATNAYDPPLPGTTNLYRVSVVRLNAFIASRTLLHQAAANRFGLVANGSSGVPGRFQGTNAAGSLLGPVDVPGRKWLILEERFTNSTADFIKISSAGDITGTNMGNTNNASSALFGNTSGTSLADSRCAFTAVKEGALPTRSAVIDALVSYYGEHILLRRRLARYAFIGDSQTRHDSSFSYRGFRKRFFDAFDTAAIYPTKSLGTQTEGSSSWEDTRHSGVSAQTIEACETFINAQFGSGGALHGVACVDLGILCIGAANIITNAESAATALVKLESCAGAFLTKEPSATLAICSLPPTSGDPANLASFNAGIPGVITSLQSTFPGRTILFVDYFAALGSAYNAAYSLDGVHMNETGSYTLAGDALVSALASTMNTLTTI